MRQESAFSCIETSGSNRSANNCPNHSILTYRDPLVGRLSDGTLEKAFIDALTEQEAYDLFFRYRWSASGGLPICPACGNNRLYTARRRRLICSRSVCGKEFPATSGTLFSSRRLSFKSIVLAIHEYASSEGRLVATRLGDKIGVGRRTAHGLRERIEQAAEEGIVFGKKRRRASR